MNKEKVLKLLNSSNLDDILIGLNFIKGFTLDDVLHNFSEAAESLIIKRTNMWPGVKIKVARNNMDVMGVYYQLSENLLCHIGYDALIFREYKLGYNDSFKIIDL